MASGPEVYFCIVDKQLKRLVVPCLKMKAIAIVEGISIRRDLSFQRDFFRQRISASDEDSISRDIRAKRYTGGTLAAIGPRLAQSPM